ncbi:MAG: PilZ domain-containing protein [Planctomycetota bacterium]
MDDMNRKERRANKRLSINQNFELFLGDEKIACQLTDLSPNGLGLIASSPLPELAVLGLELEIEGHEGRPDLRITATAVVIHCIKDGEQYQVGLWFQEISEFLKLNIERYTLNLASEEPQAI